MFNLFKKKPKKEEIPSSPLTPKYTPIEIHAKLSIDDFESKKMVISEPLGFVHSWDRSDSSILFINLINMDGKDFLDLSFERRGFIIALGDQISLLFENGYVTTYDIVREPFFVLDMEGLHIHKTKFQIEAFDLEEMKKYNIKKLRIVYAKSKAAYDYEFHLNSQKIPMNVIANDYYKLVVKEIENYQPLEILDEEENIESQSNYEKVYVYLMIDTVNGYHKIGISNRPKYREKTLQSEKPTIEMICNKKFPNRKIASSIEQVLHQNYSEKRIRGEWFKLDESDVNDIKQVLS